LGKAAAPAQAGKAELSLRCGTCFLSSSQPWPCGSPASLAPLQPRGCIWAAAEEPGVASRCSFSFDKRYVITCPLCMTPKHPSEQRVTPVTFPLLPLAEELTCWARTGMQRHRDSFPQHPWFHCGLSD